LTPASQPTLFTDESMRTFLLYFDDPDVGPEVFTDEAEARELLKVYRCFWNCRLFVEVSA
jgi:hypothetical protein